MLEVEISQVDDLWLLQSPNRSKKMGKDETMTKKKYSNFGLIGA